MSIEFVCGRAGSGKSRCVFEHIRQLLRDPLQKTVVIVPEQYTFQMEREIMERCHVAGFMGLSVLSFKRLVFRILEEAGGRAVKSLNGAAKCMLIRLAIHEHLDEIQAFKKSARETGFDLKMSELFSDLKRYDVSAEALLQASNDLQIPYLKEKASDIALLYRIYGELMDGRCDSEDLINIATENATEADFLCGANLIIDGFDMLTTQIKRLVKKIISISSTALVTFRFGEENDPDAALFSPEINIYKDLCAFAKTQERPVLVRKLPDDRFKPRHASSELAHLERNLYAFPYEALDQPVESISLYTARNLAGEVTFAAEKILNLIRHKGYRYRDIGVLTDTAAYGDLIKSIFMANDIPVFVDSKRPLTESSPVVFIDSALGILCTRWRLSEVMRHIQCGYTQLSEDETEALLNYQKAYGIRGYHFIKPFRRGGQEAEEYRKKLVSPLERLSERMHGKVPEMIRALLDYLQELDVFSKIENFAKSLEAAGLLYEAQFYTQAAERVKEILEQAADIFEKSELSAQELRAVLAAGFESVQIAVVPPALDEVTVGDLKRSKLKSIKALFVIGLNEGVIPSRTDTGGILTLDERLAFHENGLVFGEVDKNEAEKLNIYAALSKPEEYLCLTYSSGSGASVLVDKIKKIFPQLALLSDTEDAIRMHILTPKGMLTETGAALRSLLDIQTETQGLPETLSWYMQNGYEEKIRLLARELLFENDPADIGRKRAEALFGGIRGSVSRIEEYYGCPFKHFLRYGIKAEELKDYTDNAADAGTLMHGAVDRFAKKLKSKGLEWKNIGDRDLDENLREAVDEAVGENARGFAEDKRLSGTLSRLKQELAVSVRAIRWQLEHTDVSVLGSEMRFGTPEGLPAYEVPLENGDRAVITGCIDRADLLEAEDIPYVRVVDYKSGSKKFDFAEFAYGLNIQLVVYLMVLVRYLKSLGQEVKPAGFYYFSFVLPFLDTDEKGESGIYETKQMEGITLDHIGVASAFGNRDDTGLFRSIRLKVKSGGEELESRSKARVFTGDDFDHIFRFAEGLIEKALEGVYSGRAEISPAITSSGSACDYCAYARICRYDLNYAGNRPRKIPSMGKEELLLRIGEAEQ